MIKIFSKSLKSNSLQLSVLLGFYYIFFLLINIWLSGKSDLSNGILSWDAIHYEWIKENGYQGFRTVFFPAFPIVWNLLGINAVSISILNGILFITSITVLFTQIASKHILKLFIFFIPLSFFFFIPYSESLFFFGSTILLLGYVKNSPLLIVLGLALCTITRPSGLFIIPALVLLEIIIPLFEQKRINWKLLIFGIGSIVVCYFGILYSNYITEHDPFAFYNNQKLWPNKLSLIELPLRSWGSGLAGKIDGIALLIGSFLLYWNFTHLKRVKKNTPHLYKVTLISIVFLFLTIFSVILYRGGSLFSLGRFIHCSPFVLILVLNLLTFNKRSSLKTAFLVFIICTLYWLLFNSWVHIQTFLKFGIASLYVVLLYFNINSSFQTKKGKILISILFITNSFLLVWFFQRFISGEWIG